MGNFYANFTIRIDAADAVTGTLQNAKRDAFFAHDPKTRCVVIFERETDSQDAAAIVKLGKLLSTRLNAPVIAAANEDDDVFRYWLFRDGKQIDSFDSSFEKVSEQNFIGASGGRVVISKWDPNNPDAVRASNSSTWQPAARKKDERGGNVALLTEAFGVPAAAEKVMKVLLKEYDFVLDQHRAFCKAVGLSPWAVGGGFGYVASNQLPKGLRPSQLVRVSRVGTAHR